MATEASSVVLVIVSTLFSSIGSFYMKVGSKDFRIGTVITNLPLIVGLGLHGLSAVIGVVAYRHGELTILVPLASFNYVWASILAVHFLGEKMNKWKWLGIGLIMVGVSLVGLGDVL